LTTIKVPSVMCVSSDIQSCASVINKLQS